MRPDMTTAGFWAAAGERAVKTAAQAIVALIGTGAVGITALDWQQIGSVSATAAAISVLTSLASDRIGASGPSLVGEGRPAPLAADPPTGSTTGGAEPPADTTPGGSPLTGPSIAVRSVTMTPMDPTR